jgi:hypothetical protein
VAPYTVTQRVTDTTSGAGDLLARKMTSEKKEVNVDRMSMLTVFLVTGFLTACASKGGPVSMLMYESDFFSIEFPQGWYATSRDISDSTKVVFSKGELSPESETALEGPGFAVGPSDYPFFLVMFTPYQPGGEEALENTVQAFIATISQGQGDYTIVEQSSPLPRDAEVRAFIVEGSDAKLGRGQGHTSLPSVIGMPGQ